MHLLCLFHFVSSPLSLPLCLYRSVSSPLSLPLCLCPSISSPPSLPLRHCRIGRQDRQNRTGGKGQAEQDRQNSDSKNTSPLSLPLCLFPSVTTPLSLPLCLFPSICSPPYFALCLLPSVSCPLSLPLCLFLSVSSPCLFPLTHTSVSSLHLSPVSLPLCLFNLPTELSYSRPLFSPCRAVRALKTDFHCGGEEKVRICAFFFRAQCFHFFFQVQKCEKSAGAHHCQYQTLRYVHILLNMSYYCQYYLVSHTSIWIRSSPSVSVLSHFNPFRLT
jgi:hypothetical protein